MIMSAPTNDFWVVGDDAARYWSSASSSYVTVLPEGVRPSRSVSERDLSLYLRQFGLIGPAVLVEDVIDERNRRLALGFEYNFGDARGIHHIGTTEQDMAGWNEVTSWANAQIALNDTTSTLLIVTDTGPANVTALDWMNILNAATAFRQPLWASSFVLQAADPIPRDYADDKYWV